jgi:predicted membrane-bound mannosyltransferase
VSASARFILWVLVFVLGAGLRFFDLSDAPLHADEAVAAKITATRIEGGGYDFDASHYHGPSLSWAGARVAGFFGATSFRDLEIFPLRVVSAVSGALLILVPLLLLHWLGPTGALLGGLFLATSPLLCFYSRIYIHEPLLVFFSALALVFLGFWLKTKRRIAAIGFGLALGLMAATKETFAITAVSWLIGFCCVWRFVRVGKEGAIALVYLCAAFAGVLVASYGNPLEFLSTYLVYTTDPAHSKPLGYYLDLLVVPKHRPPQWWSEAGIVLLAGVGVFYGWRRKNPFLCLLAISAALQCVVYSVISYKTPWLMMVPWMQVCLLAGVGAADMLAAPSRSKAILVFSFLGIMVLFQLEQAYAAVFRYPNDARNPLVYSPTSRNVDSLSERLRVLFQKSPLFREGQIAVLGSAYWPLPWYLRNTVPTGYYDVPPGDIQNFAVVIATPATSPEIEPLLLTTHQAYYYGLRHEFPLMVFIRNDVREEELVNP